MKNKKLLEQLQKMLKKAERSLNSAKRHLQEEDFDFASSRAYYAVFYAMEAVLITRDLSFSKHAGVISEFNRIFIKSGLFPKDYGKLITRLSRERQIGDYDFELINIIDANKDVEIADRILSGIEKYLIKEGFIK